MTPEFHRIRRLPPYVDLRLGEAPREVGHGTDAVVAFDEKGALDAAGLEAGLAGDLRERGLVLAHRTMAAIDQLPLQIVPVSRATVLAAAHIKAHHPISYADSFAVVTARDHHCVLLTGDPEFRSVANAGLIPVEWLPAS